VKRDLGDGFELDDDLERIDLEEVRRFLADESYWARGRELAVQEALIREAARVVGLYHEGKQIGFCRAARLAPRLFYLADVYVLPAFRGRGFGVELVHEMLERGSYPDAKWLLHTEDAHDLYRRFGFEDPDRKLMERPSAASAPQVA
jgi:GNAT superfamily N-acetyltransferase